MAERGPVAAMPLAAPQRRTGGLLRRAAEPIVSAGTWLAVIHLMTGAITGAVALAGVIVLTVIGVTTVWFFLAGLPVLVTMLWLCLQFGRFERARFALLLGVRLPTPPVDLSSGASLWRRLWRLVAEPTTRRQFGYAVIRFPLGFAEGLILTAVWSFVVALVGLPVFSSLLLHQRWHVYAPIPWLGEMIAGTVLGLLLLPVPAQLTRGLASLDIAVARYLIGPGGSTDQTERITELERSRARVVDAAEAERRRIERDLHDGAQQRLVSLAMNLGRAKARFADDPDGGQGDHRAGAHRGQGSPGRAARPGPRGAPAGAHRPRPGRRHLRPGRALPGAGHGARRQRPAAPGIGRGHRVLRRRRGADQRGQARSCVPGRGLGHPARGRAARADQG